MRLFLFLVLPAKMWLMKWDIKIWQFSYHLFCHWFVFFLFCVLISFWFFCFDFFLFSNVYFLQVFIQIMTEMYVCSKEKGIWGGLFLSDEKSQKSNFLGYAVVGTTAQPLILWAIVFCCCFSVGGDNIRAAQQNEVECILAQNTICKIT